MIENDDIEQSWVGFIVAVVGFAILGIGAWLRKLFKD